MLLNFTLEEFFGLISLLNVDVDRCCVLVIANFRGFNAAAELVEVIVELKAIIVERVDE